MGLAHDIRLALDAAFPVGQDRAAIDLLAGMEDSTIRKIPPGAAADLMEALVRGRQTSDAEARSLYRLRRPNQAYDQWLEGKLDQAASQLKSTPQLAQLRQDWSRLDTNQRIRQCQDISWQVCQVFGLPGMTIRTFQQKPDRFNMIRLGRYDPGSGSIHLNTHILAGFNDCGYALHTLFHEMAHYLQDELANQIGLGLLPADHPAARQSRIHAANSRKRGYFTPESDIYLLQPLERDGEFLVEAMMKRLAPSAAPSTGPQPHPAPPEPPLPRAQP